MVDPKFMKYVPKPDTAANSELAKALPVHITGLPDGGGGTTAWADITGKPAVIAAGADQAAARTAIGAGTGNSSLALGTTATTAAAGNHTHAAGVVTVAAASGIVGANVQAVLADLAARVVALEAA